MIAIDDNFDENPKFVALSNDATALWVRCLGYCRRNRTDGFIPEQIAIAKARCKNPKRAIAELLAPPASAPGKKPLWKSVPGGYEVHDYLVGGWNPSRAEIEAKSEQKRAAAKLGGVASGKARAKQRGEAEANRDLTRVEARCFDSGSTESNPTPVRSGPVRSGLTETPPPQEPRDQSGGGGSAIEVLRRAVQAELHASPILRRFAHSEGVEALASAASFAGRTESAVRDAIRHLSTKAAAGAWSPNRSEGALARAIQFAKEPRKDWAPDESAEARKEPVDDHPPPTEEAIAKGQDKSYLLAYADKPWGPQ